VSDDQKRAKALRTIASLQKLIDHPNTGDGERTAAMGRITVLKAKWKITDTKPPPRPHYDFRQPGNYSKSNRVWIDEDFWETMRDNRQMTDAEIDAMRIRDQQVAYERFKKAEEAKKEAARAEADRKARVAEEKRRKAEQAKRRAEAQERWRAKHADNDHMGRPLTREEQEEARRDPLGWASKRDGRTAREKNDEMQDTLQHKAHPMVCDPKATFFDQGGEPRKRNDYPGNCYSCGSLLRKGEGALFKANGKWEMVCCESVPGPRRKKRGRN